MHDGASTLPIQEGEVLATKYRILGTIGVGGMGAVFAATHLLLDEKVAIKVLLPTQLHRPDAAYRFLREGRAASKIKSEHVARVLDVGTLGSGLPYLVMEHLDGQDLSSRISERGPCPARQVISWVLQACEAMIEAHEKGIIHRDLKPSNLFVARRHDGSEVIKVLDFGISKVSGDLADGFLTASRAVLGSPFYMAPEQMSSSGTVDARADIWSLGCILFEALTGEPPFLADDVTVLVARVLNDPSPLLRKHRPELSAELEAVVTRCLEKSPDRRFQSVRELVEALAPLVPPSEQGQVQRMLQRGDAQGPRPGEASGVSLQDTAPNLIVAGSSMADSSLQTSLPTAGPRRGLVAALVAAGLVAAGAAGALLRSSPTPDADRASPAVRPSAPASGPIASQAPSAASAPPVESALPVVSVATAPPSARRGPPAAARPPEKARAKVTAAPAGLPSDRD